MELSLNQPHDQEVFVSHANAALTPIQRRRIGKLIVEQDVPVSQAAQLFMVSWPTAKRWGDRYRAQLEAGSGPVLAAAFQDRSSRPLHSPRKTPQPIVRKIVHLRWRKRLGPVEIAGKLNMPASTVYAVLVRCRLHRLWHVDRQTGEVIRRYEHDHPGSLIHVDVKKLGNIPDGGGWRFVGRQQGYRNRTATPGLPRNKYRNPLPGKAYVHTVIDDHSRVAYVELHPCESAETNARTLERGLAFFAELGLDPPEAVMTDNAFVYVHGRRFKQILADNAAKHIRIPKGTPRWNGKVERFIRTLQDEWAYARVWPNSHQRARALPSFIRYYNRYRPHSALEGLPPISRVHNLRGQYS